MPLSSDAANREVEADAAAVGSEVDLRPDLGALVVQEAPPLSSVSARCDAQVTGNEPRSARKMTNSKPNRRPSSADRWPV